MAIAIQPPKALMETPLIVPVVDDILSGVGLEDVAGAKVLSGDRANGFRDDPPISEFKIEHP